MTTPLSDDEIQAALAEGLRGKQWVRKVMGDGHVSMLQADEFDLAAALLPVVRGIAARAIREAANDVHMPYDVRMDLHARALNAEA
jgi:hypothetical protein